MGRVTVHGRQTGKCIVNDKPGRGYPFTRFFAAFPDSDGHLIFKVQVLLQERFSKKMRSFPYIQEAGKERKTEWISTLRDR